MRKDAPSMGSEWAPLLLIGGGAVVAGGAYLVVNVARWISGQPWLPPLPTAQAMFRGDELPAASVVGAAALVGVPLLVVAVLLGRWRARSTADRLPVDRKAQHMGDPSGFGVAAAARLMLLLAAKSYSS